MLRTLWPGVPLGAIMKAIRTGEVRLDGKRTKGEARLAEGQRLTVPWNDGVKEAAAPARELMEETFPGELTVVVATTREEEEERRGDLSGRITQLLTSGELEEHVGKRITPEDARVILCGNPEFIEAARAILKERGLTSPRFGKPGQLLVESFW